MKISKRQLRLIIREEKRRMRECGEDMPSAHPSTGLSVDATIEPITVGQSVPTMVVENETPETNMLIEMEVASRALTQVVESVQNAASLCHNCGAGVVEQAPVVEAMVAQAEALQEMLEAQVDVIQENTGFGGDTMLDAVASLVQ